MTKLQHLLCDLLEQLENRQKVRVFGDKKRERAKRTESSKPRASQKEVASDETG